jgi:hypothetical protein
MNTTQHTYMVGKCALVSGVEYIILEIPSPRMGSLLGFFAAAMA